MWIRVLVWLGGPKNKMLSICLVFVCKNIFTDNFRFYLSISLRKELDLIELPEVKVQTAVLDVVAQIPVAAASNTDREVHGGCHLDANGNILGADRADDDERIQDVAGTILHFSVLLIRVSVNGIHRPSKSMGSKIVLYRPYRLRRGGRSLLR